MPEHGEGDTAMHPLQVADPDPWFAQAVPTMHSSYTGTADGHMIALVRLWIGFQALAHSIDREREKGRERARERLRERERERDRGGSPLLSPALAKERERERESTRDL